MSVAKERWKALEKDIDDFIKYINAIPDKAHYQPYQHDIDWYQRIVGDATEIIKLISDSDQIEKAIKLNHSDQMFISKLPNHLSKVKSLFNKYFADYTRYVITKTDDSLAHLQLMITIGDEQYRKNWDWGHNENHYEKFGAAQFLLHRIWSFKADASKSRTDLILIDAVGEEHSNISELGEKAFVLTEWKKYDKSKKSLDKLIQDAVGQIKEYVSPHLHMFLFEPVCYLIIVSEKSHKKEIEQVEISINSNQKKPKIKIVNIVCEPNTPSQQ
ncbi:MAG: hypothetical protein I8H80_01630 [Alphaproteobacteria bacterium]|nr:hypothetical protein [Alphaproteobacteria bacterium]